MRGLIMALACTALASGAAAKIPVVTKPVTKIDLSKLPPISKVKIAKGGVLNLTVATVTWSYTGIVSQTAPDTYKYTSNTGGTFTATTALDPSLGTGEPASMVVTRATSLFCQSGNAPTSYTPWYPGPFAATVQGGGSTLAASAPISLDEFLVAAKCSPGSVVSAAIMLTATITTKAGDKITDSVLIKAAHFAE